MQINTIVVVDNIQVDFFKFIEQYQIQIERTISRKNGAWRISGRFNGASVSVNTDDVKWGFNVVVEDLNRIMGMRKWQVAE